ncbi:Ig-like domain-containing protein [Vibrio campbellii]|uniref:Ig-like domain-containing protein n=1 Tax=Vibrio campbellii TaxID=680 RepID=UPI00215C2074|nr:Ig-like domain-containing protein [Vibrio campbellii]MCR9910982.1 Ig-like domain-containing protein [Vibrio campbellii]
MFFLKSIKVFLLFTIFIFIGCHSEDIFSDLDPPVAPNKVVRIQLISSPTHTNFHSHNSILIGNEQTYAAIATYKNGETEDITQKARWHSSDTNVIAVKDNGVVFGVGAGKAKLTAEKDGVVSNAQILLVDDASLVSIQITASKTSIPKGKKEHFFASALLSNGNSVDVTSKVRWHSSTNDVLSFTSRGLVTALDIGVTEVKGILDGVSSNTIKIEVTKPIITNIEIFPKRVFLPAGSSQQYKVTAEYSDSSILDVSDKSEWIIENEDIAYTSLTNKGMVMTKFVGQTRVIARFEKTLIISELSVIDAALQRIMIEPESVSLPVGHNEQLIAKGIYTDGTSQNITKSVFWSSDDFDLVNVNVGLIKGLQSKSGSVAVVTASLDNIRGSARVNVSDAVLESVQVTPARSTVPIGGTKQFIATGIYSDGYTKDLTHEVTWSSSDEDSVEISQNGIVSGVKISDQVKVLALIEGLQGDARLSVTNAVLENLQLTPAVSAIPKGLSQQYLVTGIYSDLSASDLTKMVNWTSGDEAVVKIDNQGLALAVQASSSPITITSKLGGLQSSAQLSVTEAVLEGIQILPADLTLPVGRTQQYTAMGLYSDGTTKDLTNVVAWQSGSSEHVDMSSEGIASANNSTSSVTIDACFNGTIGSASLKVTDAVLDGLQVLPTNTSIPVGHSQSFRAIGTFSDGSRREITSEVSWVSSDLTSATVSAHGLVMGVSPAEKELSITATLGSVRASGELLVTDAILQRVAVAPKSASLALGRSQKYQLTGHYSDGQELVINDASWSCSEPHKATVEQTGVAKGIAPGRMLLTAQFNGFKDSGELIVTDAILEDISISPRRFSLAKGDSYLFKVVGQFSDGSVRTIKNNVSWVSNDIAIATVSDSGIINGHSVGPVTITAKVEKKEAQVEVMVTEANLKSIKLSPDSISLYTSEILKFKVIGLYGDGEERELPDGLLWSSSSPSIDIDQKGYAVARFATSNTPATIIAKIGNLSAIAMARVLDVSISVLEVHVPNDGRLKVGEETQALATLIYTTGQRNDVSKDVVWQLYSTHTDAISITDSGKIIGLNPGTGQIRAYSFDLGDGMFRQAFFNIYVEE